MKEFVALAKVSFWSINGLILLLVSCLREETKMNSMNQDEGCLVLA